MYYTIPEQDAMFKQYFVARKNRSTRNEFIASYDGLSLSLFKKMLTDYNRRYKLGKFSPKNIAKP